MKMLVKTGKNTEINKQSSFSLVKENMELFHVYKAVLNLVTQMQTRFFFQEMDFITFLIC